MTATSQEGLAGDAADECDLDLQAAQGETDSATLEALQTSCTASRDDAVTASNAVSNAHITAVATKDGDLATATALVSTKQATIASLKADCDQALADVAQYTDTQVQLDAAQRVADACAAVDGAKTSADSAVSTASTLTSGAATTVDAIFNLSLDAANHVDDANSFLSAIGDLITANNDSNAEAVNDQAALTIATDAEAYATASG